LNLVEARNLVIAQFKDRKCVFVAGKLGNFTAIEFIIRYFQLKESNEFIATYSHQFSTLRQITKIFQSRGIHAQFLKIGKSIEVFAVFLRELQDLCVVKDQVGKLNVFISSIWFLLTSLGTISVSLSPAICLILSLRLIGADISKMCLLLII